MIRFFQTRSLPLASAVLSLLLLASSSEAQRKKAPAPAKKKPAATAPAKPKAQTAPAAAPTEPKSSDAETGAKPDEEAPSDKGDKEKEKEKEKDRDTREPSSGSKHPILDLSFGLRGFQRHLAYKTDVYRVLPSYDLGGAPALDLGVGLFPIQTPGMSIGITGTFEYAFLLGSKYKTAAAGQPEKITTKAMQYSVGARGNFFLGGGDSLGLGVDYGAQSFVVDLPPPTATNAGVPDVKYSYVRPNLSGRFGLSDKFAVLVGAGYLFVLSAGEILEPTYFTSTRAKVGAYDATFGVSYQLASHLELRPALDFRRYYYTFNPAHDGTQHPAGGATDDFYGISVSLGYSL